MKVTLELCVKLVDQVQHIRLRKQSSLIGTRVIGKCQIIVKFFNSSFKFLKKNGYKNLKINDFQKLEN